MPSIPKIRALFGNTRAEREVVGSREPRTSQIRLLVEGREGWANTHLIGPDGRAMIGRGPSNDINLRDGHVSSRHCEIVRDGLDFVLRDLGSSNGTMLNEKDVKEVPLRHQDIVQLGMTRVSFLTDSDDAFMSYDMEEQGTGSYRAYPEPQITVAGLSEDQLRQELLHARMRIQRMGIVNEFSRLVARSPSALHKAQSALHFITHQVNAESGMLVQVDPVHGLNTIRAMSGGLTEWSVTGDDRDKTRTPLSLAIINQVMKNRRPMVTHSALEDPRFSSAISVGKRNVQACMCYPLVFNEEAVGAVYVDRRNSLEPFSSWEESLYQMLTDQLNRIFYPVPSNF